MLGLQNFDAAALMFGRRGVVALEEGMKFSAQLCCEVADCCKHA
jgi:hypothetical protein